VYQINPLDPLIAQVLLIQLQLTVLTLLTQLQLTVVTVLTQLQLTVVTVLILLIQQLPDHLIVQVLLVHL
jgi:hypothetical protein